MENPRPRNLKSASGLHASVDFAARYNISREARGGLIGGSWKGLDEKKCSCIFLELDQIGQI